MARCNSSQTIKRDAINTAVYGGDISSPSATGGGAGDGGFDGECRDEARLIFDCIDGYKIVDVGDG